jgi:hypothetical protein
MLAFLALGIFVGQPLETLNVVHPAVVGVVFALALVSGVAAMATHRRATVAMALTAVAAVVVRSVALTRPSRTIAIWDLLLTILAFAVLTTFAMFKVFRAGPVTADRILGSVLAYLLLGILWCFAYQLVDLLVPEAFRTAEPLVPIPGRMSPQLAYFSFITLTTVGYGDITPVYPVVRTLAAAEALVGQLYPAILIARLVSLHAASRPAAGGK